MSVEFGAGFFQGELPFYGGPRCITLSYASGDVGGEFVLRGDALAQALASDGREFELDHIEPGGVFRGVMHLEAGGQGAGMHCGQVLGKNGVGMRVEVVLHQDDFLGLRLVSG